jgi:hypothetical protein
MTDSTAPGYIYIPNWDTFQHYKDRRPAWIKNYLDLLDNDAYLELSVFDRGVLHAIWMLVARVGQGRCSASAAYLQRQCRTPAGHMQRSLERLNQAGFIEVRDSRALAIVYPARTTEVEGSKEPKREIESARANGAAVNGSIAAHKKEVELAIRTATAWLPDDPRHLVEHTIHQTWPDLADEVIAGLPREEPA